MEKPKVVILDGVDGTGKSTLRKFIHEKHASLVIIERFTPSIYAYGFFFGRDVDRDYLRRVEEGFREAFDVVPVLLIVSDPDGLHKRYLEGRHMYVFTKADLVWIQSLMLHYVKGVSRLEWHVVDTCFREPEETFRVFEEVLGR